MPVALPTPAMVYLSCRIPAAVPYKPGTGPGQENTPKVPSPEPWNSAGALRGSFAAFVPAAAWPAKPREPGFIQAGKQPGVFIGAWSASAGKARGYFLPLGLFDSHNGTTITEENAIHSVALEPGPRVQPLRPMEASGSVTAAMTLAGWNRLIRQRKILASILPGKRYRGPQL
jgi:hypothetical protein